LDHLGSYNKILSFAKFTYNNNYQTNIDMNPYEMYKVQIALCWF